MRDVIVIGAGGGGPVVAKELAARGLDVLVLESGARFKDPRKEWTHFEDDANNVETGYLRVGPTRRDLSPYLRAYPGTGFVWQAMGVGGTTLHYYGNHPRAYPGVFRDYAGADAGNYDTQHRFPFSYETLRPYYEWVEATLPVATAPVGRKEAKWLTAAEELGLPLQKTRDASGFAYRPQENAVLQPGGTAGKVRNPAFPQATGCTMCGHCLQGCMEPNNAPRNLFARRSTDNSYAPMMLTADAWADGGRAVELITDAHVTQIHTQRRFGREVATGVSWKATDGAEQREQAKVVVLAGGIVESPRLWLNSKLPNPNGWVGRGLADHHPDLVVGVMDDDIGTTRGNNSQARLEFPGYGCIEQLGLLPAFQAFAMNFSDSGYAQFDKNGNPVGPAGADSVGRVRGKDLLDVMRDTDKLMLALVLTDDDVQAHNRVTTPSLFTDDQNGPTPSIRVDPRRRTARTRRNRQFLAQRAAQLMRAAGARRVLRIDWPPLVFHPHSTMRMGDSARDSVLRDTAESRWVDRLYVADNSALANALGGPNPTNTTQAIGTRTAEDIFSRYFGGEAWVGKEAPVSSIDDRVTRAVLSRGL